MPRPFREITEDDVGKASIRAFGRTWLCSGFIGRILPQDVGKRIYLVRDNTGVSDFLQVENDSQRNARQKGSK